MKYAIISDIHGNLSALNTILEDAKDKKVDGFILVGDYCLSNPFPDECISRIKELNNAYIIRGNEERYLENLIGKDQSTWNDGQMQISYWCYQNIRSDNLQYLLSLPERIDIVINDVPLHIAHSSSTFIDNCEHKDWNSASVACRYQNAVVSSKQFHEDIHRYFANNKEFNEMFPSLSNGVYIFGHSHTQWSYQSEDGKKILINPGSCGLPLDCIQAGIPYTIIDIANDKSIQLNEIRIPVNRNEYINALLQSSQYEKANVWSKVIIKELTTCREHLTFFLQYVEKYAQQIGDSQRPYSVKTWEKAYELWDTKNK